MDTTQGMTVAVDKDAAASLSSMATDGATTLAEFTYRLLGRRPQFPTYDGESRGHLHNGFGSGQFNNGKGFGDGEEYGNGIGMGHGDGETGMGNGQGYGHGEAHEQDDGGGYDYSD